MGVCAAGDAARSPSGGGLGLSCLHVHFCGVRGSTPAPGIDFVKYGGHTSCVALTSNGAGEPSLILDAGTGLLAAARLIDDSGYRGTILLTHLHWDHILGLPFFHVGDRPAADVQMFVPEQPGVAQGAEVLKVVMTPPYFPIEPTELRGTWRFGALAPGELEVDGFHVLAREVPHKGGRTFGYRVQAGGRTLAYIPDHSPTTFGPGPDGLGEYHAAALELAQDADLLIHDAQLMPEELPAEARYGHAAADYAVRLAEHAGARAVALFHHRPDRTDAQLDELGERLSELAPSVTVAAEGTDLRL